MKRQIFIILSFLYLVAATSFIAQLDANSKLEIVQQFKTKDDQVFYPKIISVQKCTLKTYCRKTTQKHFLLSKKEELWLKVHAKIFDGSGNFVKNIYLQQHIVPITKTPVEPGNRWPWYTYSLSILGTVVFIMGAFLLLLKFPPRKRNSATSDIVYGYDFESGKSVTRKSEFMRIAVEDLELYEK